MSPAPAAREEVWQALSDLFLDTDVSQRRETVLRVLRASPFDRATLDRIFIEEVYPVCFPNLMQVAGEWAGFDRDHLITLITAQQRKPRPGRIRLWLRWRAARRMVPEWFVIRQQLANSIPR